MDYITKANGIIAASILIAIIIVIIVTAVITADIVKGKIHEEMVLQAHYGRSFTLRGKDHVRSYRLIAAADLLALTKKAESANPTWDFATANGKQG